MKFGIISLSGRIICDPIRYDQTRFTNIVKRYGGNTEKLPEQEPTGTVDCLALKIVPGRDIPSIPPHPHAYTKTLQPWRVAGDELQRGFDFHLLPIDEIRDNLTEALSDIRWRHETGGIDLAGSQILTDRESYGMLSNTYTSLKNGLVPDAQWKSATGWITVTLPALEPIAKAVAEHVRAAFAAERYVSEQIITKALDTDALLAIDLQHEFDQALTQVAV